MSSRLVPAAVLFACAFALRGETFYRIELIPSGELVSKSAPAWKGSTLVFRHYPDGTLMSVRRTDVRKITQVTSAQDLARRSDQVIQIGNLAMQGGGAQAGPTNASAAAVKAGPALGKGFYSAVVPGLSIGEPNSPNDYQVGRTFAGPPANAVQSSPGAPPTAPAATSGQNPPQ